ncbi:MAG: PilZ domain-containing protein [Planctomycetes bacterium]|nr:PilZ domain-containing protein [Planctomycetota bacterium]
MKDHNRRDGSRLRLVYPIRLHADGERHGRIVGQTVTKNLSSRGAYFSTFDAGSYRVGQELGIAICVPHRMTGSTRDVLLDLRGKAKVVRMDGPSTSRMYGEDGHTLTGVALQFEEPLEFHYAWM